MGFRFAPSGSLLPNIDPVPVSHNGGRITVFHLVVVIESVKYKLEYMHTDEFWEEFKKAFPPEFTRCERFSGYQKVLNSVCQASDAHNGAFEAEEGKEALMFMSIRHTLRRIVLQSWKKLRLKEMRIIMRCFCFRISRLHILW